MKYKRHSKILSIIADGIVNTQEGITNELKNSGFKVTQATVSRDIKELGLIKIPTSDGSYKYVQQLEQVHTVSATQHINMFSGAVQSITCAMHTIVIKTFPGAASAVAASVDKAMENEILGSIAGDDTVLIITSDIESAIAVKDKLMNIFR